MPSISLRLCFLVTVLFMGLAVSQSNDNESSKVNAPTASKLQPQQEQAELGSKQQQQTQQAQSPSELSYPDSVPLYSPILNGDDKNDAILVPIDFPSQDLEQFDDLSEADMMDIDMGDGEAAEPSEVGELKSDDDKRYRPRFVGKRYGPRFVGKRYGPRFVGKRYGPRFVGKRYGPRFVGKRYTPRFVGKRYTPRFVGKRYGPRFVGKRYTPRFVGKRYTPRFVGRKRDAEQTNDETTPHTIEKRAAPRFVGKRQVSYDPLSAWLLGSAITNDLGNDDEFYGSSTEDDSSSSGCQDDALSFEQKRGAPRFIGKRGIPRFVGKRGVPRFVGKRFRPRFVGRRGAPRFVGKRGVPRFVGKRYGEINPSDYIFQWEAFNDVYDKRGAPRFVGKKSVFNDLEKDRLQEKDIRAILKDWSRAMAIKQHIDNDKRWTSPVTPTFIGKRMDSVGSEFER